MENPKVMIPATMETFRFMDLRGGGKKLKEEVARIKNISDV